MKIEWKEQNERFFSEIMEENDLVLTINYFSERYHISIKDCKIKRTKNCAEQIYSKSHNCIIAIAEMIRQIESKVLSYKDGKREINIPELFLDQRAIDEINVLAEKRPLREGKDRYQNLL